MANRRGSSRRPHRSDTPGRRRTDMPIRNYVDRKLLVVTVVVVNALYLAGDALLFKGSICP